ncbi:MAG: ribosomal protein methyltransferase [Solirubrobacteraceae bacterium]|nr:ribosomal protein methyltransferase [Solirubrobacteraceae bacterium]
MIRLALRVRRADAELVLAELLELAPNGVEETAHDDVVEFAVYGWPGEVPALPALQAVAGEALVDVETTEIPDDWTDGWKRFHQPVTVGERLYVRPPWADAAPADLLDLVIDPGQAFGTGSHRTTRMCLELMLELEPGGPFADLGCGSGVLGVAAAKLGWDPVFAVDHEPASVEAAQANARANGVALDVRRVDLRRDPAPNASTVAANLLRPLLLGVAETLVDLPHHLIAGGLLVGEADEVAAAFASRGLAELERRQEGDWAALLLRRG